jgi:hypothetical protein
VGAGAAALGVAAGGLGNALLGRFSVASYRAAVRLPGPAVPAPAVPAGTDLRIPGLTPFLTSNASFYRVDTDLVLPQVSPETWTLTIDGMVDRPVEITFAELLKMPLTEADITLVCVSNQVGGTYNGNATWLGVPLAGLLRRAGVRAGADQVLSAATDGMTISTPVEAPGLAQRVHHPVGPGVVAGPGHPLPVARVVRHFAVREQGVEVPVAVPPVDAQVAGEERGGDHPGPVVHEALGGQLAQARAHAWCSAGLSCSRRSRVKTTIAVSI